MSFLSSMVVVTLVVASGCGGSTSKPVAVVAPRPEVASLSPTAVAIDTTSQSTYSCTRVAIASIEGLDKVIATAEAAAPGTLGTACDPMMKRLFDFVRSGCTPLSDPVTTTFKGEVGQCSKALAQNKAMALGSMKVAAFGAQLDGLTNTEPGTTTTTATTGAGVSFETFALNAVTDFVVARTKAEVLGWVADEFGNALCSVDDGKGVNVRTYFPNTCAIFMKADGYVDADIADFGRALQVAVQRDLRDAIGRLINAALAHSNPRVRILMAFAQGWLEKQKLSDALARADKVMCGSDVVACGVKVGLYVVAEPTAFDSKQPALFVAAVNAAITKSADGALKAHWGEWNSKWNDVATVVAAAQAAKASLAGLTKLDVASVLEAETALATFVDALGKAAPLNDDGKALLAAAGRGLTAAREWTDLAVASYRVIDGIRRGDDPVGLLVAAGGTLQCRTGRDVICGLKVATIVVDAITQTTDWNKVDISNVDKFEQLATDVVASYNKALATPTDDTKAWAQQIGGPELRSTTKSMIAQLRRISELVQSAYKVGADGQPLDRAKMQERARDVLAAVRAAFALAGTIGLRHAGDGSAYVARAEQLVDDVFAAWTALEEGDAGQFVVALFAAADELGVRNALPGSMRKYVPLVTALASAHDSAEVKAALEKYAAPVGGYKEKRTRSWMASLTALPGLGAGYEKLDSSDDKTFHGQGGLFAPIGIDVACGKGHWCNGFGLMLSIIDIGNLISIRFDDVDAPDPSFKQVFSPGAFVRYNVRGPFNIGFGAAAVPALRRPEVTSVTDADPVAGFKLVGFLAADVTIFPF